MGMVLPVLAALAIAAAAAGGMAQAQEGGIRLQETAQVLVDRASSQNVTASITLQSTDTREITIPSDLERDMREHDRVGALVVTNHDKCVLGVAGESCIMVNTERDLADRGILEIQASAREAGDMFIGRINEFFGTDAKFHSSFVHTTDPSSLAAEGAISGRGVVSAVYTMPMEDTFSMYEKISALLLPRDIRGAGGFYDAATELSKNPDSRMAFTMIPADTESLLQLRLSLTTEGGAAGERISPLGYLGADRLERSAYFRGSYPVNSLVQVVVLSPSESAVSSTGGPVLPTQLVDGERLPLAVDSPGWIFDPAQGTTIQAKYIFGGEGAVLAKDLEFALGSTAVQEPSPPGDGSAPLIIAITAIAAAAALFYLRGYGRAPKSRAPEQQGTQAGA